MQGNFIYQNPTKLIFGEDAIHSLREELKNYGPKVLLTYGGGSVITHYAQKRKIGKGKSQDWMVHMFGQAIGAFTDATFLLTDGYKTLTHEEIVQILKESL